MNRAKEKLRAGGIVLAFNPNFPSPALVEHAGSLGFDVAFIDCEHGTAGFERVEELARAARAGGMTSIVRPHSHEPGLITRYLDCGVGGIQFPGVEDAQGIRGLIDIVRKARGARFEETLCVAMIESLAAADRLHEIVAVEGLDAIVVGLSDLARSLCHPGESAHSEVQAVVERIISIVKGSGKVAPGFNLHRWEDGRAWRERGVRWFNVHFRSMLARGAREVRTLLDLDAKAPS